MFEPELLAGNSISWLVIALLFDAGGQYIYVYAFICVCVSLNVISMCIMCMNEMIKFPFGSVCKHVRVLKLHSCNTLVQTFHLVLCGYFGNIHILQVDSHCLDMEV